MKIKAFTIIELTVVMLLSSIVISIAYFAFDMLTIKYLRYKKDNEVRYEMTNINSLLNHAFYISDSVIVTGNTIHAHIQSAVIDYELTPECILKYDRGITDTFHFPVSKMEYLYENEHITEGIIDQAHLEMELGDKKINTVFSKKYNADFTMNRNQNQ